MRRFKHTELTDVVDINISPLIDMMFLLLIFFIVTTAFNEEAGIDIDRPNASNSKILEKNSIIIEITEKNRIIYFEQEIQLNSVRGLVSKLLGKENRSVILLADNRSQSGILIQVLDECKKAGAKNVSVATEHKTGKK